MQKQKLVRKRIYEINNFKTTDEKKVYAKHTINEINRLLEEGYHFDTTKKNSKPVKYIYDVIKRSFEIKAPELAERSKVAYNDILSKFQAFLNEKHYTNIQAENFDEGHAVEFRNYLGSIGLAGASINSRISYIKTLFNIGIENKMLLKNPFSGIRKVKEVKTKRNRAFNDEEFKLILNELRKQKSELYYACCFIYYCFLRPDEVRYLRVSQVDLKGCKVVIPATYSKVKVNDYVDIIPDFAIELKEYLKEKKKTDFIFGDNEPYGRNTMRLRFNTLLRKLEISDPDICLYSFKHTGNIHAYKAGVDLKALQRQNRHTSVETTDIYLKSLMLYENTEFINKFKKSL